MCEWGPQCHTHLYKGKPLLVLAGCLDHLREEQVVTKNALHWLEKIRPQGQQVLQLLLEGLQREIK